MYIENGVLMILKYYRQSFFLNTYSKYLQL